MKKPTPSSSIPATERLASIPQEGQSPLVCVSLCGEFQVEWQVPSATEEALWDGRTSARTLLKLLLCAPGRQAPKSVLAGILWPETDEEKARESLRQASSLLRKMLCTASGEALAEQRNNGEILKLVEQSRLWVDADAFEALVSKASRVTVADEALTIWQEAHALLAGEFLADDQASEWVRHPWVKRRKQALWMALSRLIRQLADRYLQQGQVSLAEEVLEQHLVRFPSDQDALYRLLVLLEQQQCYEQACILYEQTKRVLEAAGKQPAKHVKAYYEHLQTAAQAPEHQETHTQIQVREDRFHLDPLSVSQLKPILNPQPIPPVTEHAGMIAEQLLGDPVEAMLSRSISGDLLTLFSPTIAQGIIGQVRGAKSQEMNALRRKFLQELLGMIGTILALSTGTEHFLTPEPWEQLLAATSEPSLMTADTLNYYLQLIEACWGLCNAGETTLARQVLESFLPRMVQLVPHQSAAALVAAQGLRLQSILCAHQLRLVEMVPPSQMAVAFAKQAHDPDTLSAALNGLAVAFKYAGDLDASFTTYQEALAYSTQASPLLRSRVYAGSASMFAQRGRSQEALFYIGLAYESFPDHPESDPHVLSADNGIYMLAYYQGLMYLAMNQPEEADKAFESYKRHPLGGTIPERNRLEIINHQGRAAIMGNDLDKYLACLKEGITGAITLKSKKRFDEAVTIYRQDVPEQWHHETATKQMVEQLQLPTGAE